MLLKDLDLYFKELLLIDDFSGVDNSLNGLQVGDYNMEISRIAFAVDACAEIFKRAVALKAQALFVHHGLFWGKIYPFTGRHYKRLQLLTKNDLALYAAHLPLDSHPAYGNAAGIADKLGLTDREQFGEHRRKYIGCKGKLPKKMTLDQIKIELDISPNMLRSELPFGKDEIESLGIITGGAAWESFQAIDQELDLYITGDPAHEIYYHCLEAGINVISAGHYFTETFGVKTVCAKTAEDLGIETVYIDLPTGL